MKKTLSIALLLLSTKSFGVREKYHAEILPDSCFTHVVKSGTLEKVEGEKCKNVKDIVKGLKKSRGRVGIFPEKFKCKNKKAELLGAAFDTKAGDIGYFRLIAKGRCVNISEQKMLATACDKLAKEKVNCKAIYTGSREVTREERKKAHEAYE